MRLSLPIPFFALACLLSFAGPSFAQAPLAPGAQLFDTFEDWESAGATRPGGVTISVEQTIEETERVDNFEFNEKLLAESPTLTFPWGTFTRLDGQPYPATGANKGILRDMSEVVATPKALTRIKYSSVITPNAALGTAVGFVTADQNLTNSEVAAIFTRPYNSKFTFYENDDVLGEMSMSRTVIRPSQVDDYEGKQGFTAPPGRCITRVEMELEFINLTVPPADLGFSLFDNPGHASEKMGFMFGEANKVGSPQDALAEFASDIDALIGSTTNSCGLYRLNAAQNFLESAANDIFYEDDGIRLSRYGSSVFRYSAYAIFYLQNSGVAGADELADEILETLEAIVEAEIAYAIDNDGRECLIHRAECLADLGDYIDDELGNEYVASMYYRFAWINAYYATY